MQSASAQATGTFITVALPGSVMSGDAIVVGCQAGSLGGATTAISASDTQANTFARDVTASVVHPTDSFFDSILTATAHSTASDAVTCSSSNASVAAMKLQVLEVYGVNASGVTIGSGTGVGSTMSTSPVSFSPGAFLYAIGNDAQASTCSAGAGFTGLYLPDDTETEYGALGVGSPTTFPISCANTGNGFAEVSVELPTDTSQWQYGWDVFSGALDFGYSHVQWIQPDQSTLDVTYVFVGANPNTSFTVGIALLYDRQSACRSSFGQFSLGPCFDVTRQGVMSWEDDTNGVSPPGVGSVTTDGSGYGTLSVSFTGIVAGSYVLEFYANSGLGPGSINFQAPGPFGTGVNLTFSGADTDLGIAAASDITAPATAPGGAAVTYTQPNATDEGGETPSIGCDPPSGATFPIGATTVGCTATDPDDTPGSVSTSFTISVEGADEQLSSLAANLAGASGGSFMSQLDSVQSSFDAGRTRAACNNLNAFSQHVHAQSGHQLTQAQATQALATATRIAHVIGC